MFLCVHIDKVYTYICEERTIEVAVFFIQALGAGLSRGQVLVLPGFTELFYLTPINMETIFTDPIDSDEGPEPVCTHRVLYPQPHPRRLLNNIPAFGAEEGSQHIATIPL